MRYLLLLFSILSSQDLMGHGTLSDPISRVRLIYLEGPDSPDSAAASAAVNLVGPGAYYTWNQVSLNVPDYATLQNYSSVISDGELASAGNRGPSGLNFSGLDLATSTWNWPATAVAAGPYTLNWLATAPHDPSFFKVWITNEGHDPAALLTWSGLTYLGQFNGGDFTKEGLDYRIPVTLPARTGRHVLYVAWQRIDPVGEVFFSTSDITFDGNSGGGGGTGGGNSDPVISLADSIFSETDTSVTLTVTLDQAVPAGESVTADYTTIPGTADATDYTPVSGSLTFNQGGSSASIPLSITNDSLAESIEVFSILLSNVVGATPDSLSANVTILDDDTPSSSGYDWVARDVWSTGYNGWLTLSNPTNTAITGGTLTITAPDGQTFSLFSGATSNGDGTYSVNIPAQGSIQIDLGFTKPSSDSPSGPAIVTLNGAPLSLLPPGFSIESISLPEGDGPSQATLNVTLSRAHGSDLHVSYQTIDDSAIAPEDYTDTTGTIVFATGETQKTITVPIIGDALSEGDESFKVVLGGVSGQTPPRFVSPTSHLATVTLQDDDGAILFTAAGATLIEGDSGQQNMTFRMFLSRAVKTGEIVSTDYMAHGHGATHGSDFALTTGTYQFASGSTEGSIQVPIIGDTIDERHEWFNLHFSNPVGLSLQSTEATGQIIDNEFTGQLEQQRVVAYVDGTGGALRLPPANRVTHIMYAFANLNLDGTLQIPASASSNLVTINALRSQNPNLKVLLSVGGWTWSSNFSAVASDPSKRAIFGQSCVNALQAHDLDGIDLDWEWPGVSGGPGTVADPADGPRYTELVRAVRLAIDAEGAAQSPAKHFELSAFTAAGPSGIAALELSELAPLFDFVNAQGYDLHGPWNGRTGHNAGLYDNSADPGDDRLNIDSILAAYRAGGFKRNQLLIGAPFYARRFYSVGDTANGLFQPASSTGDAPFYRDIISATQTTVRHWDPYAKVAFLYDWDTSTWTSLDDARSMHEKALYSREQGYGGIYYWQNGGDTDDQQLLTTISDSLARVDHDLDGLDDGWEISHFGDLTTANDTSNNDGDCYSDLAEEAFKTDPGDAANHPRFQILSTDEIIFGSKIGVTYQLQTSTTLTPNSWESLGVAIDGTGGILDLSNFIPADLSNTRFYRLVTTR